MDADHVGIWPITAVDGRWQWVLVGAPLTRELGKAGSGFFLIVPDGFVSDLVTRPKSRLIAWLIDANDPQTARAAIVHDALLAQHFEQRMAAGEFYRVLVEDGVPVWKAILYFAAVLIASDNWRNQPM
jgi:hypothetical protein